MKFLFRILRRLVGYLLGVLLVALIAAAATFGWQGYKLYQSAVGHPAGNALPKHHGPAQLCAL